ncbi:MAG: TPM domain-containing protein [Clostridia bacterium]|nr:TPM domain-containing protein [Clostridia bacterium]
MMKRFVSLTLALLLTLCLFATAASALEGDTPYVDDRRDLFYSGTEATLSSRCKALSEQYETTCLILTTGSLSEEYPDLSDVSDYTFESIIMDYADLYLESVIGVGDENDGIVLVIYVNENNPSDRGYWISTQGKEVSAFMSSIEGIKSRVKSELSHEDFEDAASVYLDCVEYVARDGALPAPPIEPPSLTAIVVCLAIGFVIALIIVFSMKSKMKNVHAATAADSYLQEDTVNIRNCNVVFIRKSVTRTARQSSSSSGGGGSHHSSSGTSHGGGGGRF